MQLCFMEISIYRKWIDDGAKYSEGVALYELYGDNKSLKDLFSQGKNIYTSKKLNDELKALSEITPVAKSSKIDRDQLPAHLQKELDAQGDRIRKISYLHAQLMIVDDKDVRYTIARKILSIALDRKVSFQKIDHYLETGENLEQKKATPEAPKEIPQEIEFKALKLRDELKLLRSRRTKLKTNKKRVHDYNAIVNRIAAADKELKDLMNGSAI